MKRYLVVAVGLMVTACGNGTGESAPPATPSAPATEQVSEPQAAQTGPMKEPGEANVGDKSKCPVSGEEFVVEASSPKVEHDGKTYYFCCGACQQKFEADPAKFVQKI